MSSKLMNVEWMLFASQLVAVEFWNIQSSTMLLNMREHGSECGLEINYNFT